MDGVAGNRGTCSWARPGVELQMHAAAICTVLDTVGPGSGPKKGKRM